MPSNYRKALRLCARLVGRVAVGSAFICLAAAAFPSVRQFVSLYGVIAESSRKRTLSGVEEFAARVS